MVPRGDLPLPTFFFPDPAESIPPVYEGGGRRGNININTMAFSMDGNHTFYEQSWLAEDLFS